MSQVLVNLDIILVCVALRFCQLASESADAMNEVVHANSLHDMQSKPKLWYDNCMVNVMVREVTTLPKQMAATTGYPVLELGVCDLRAFGGSTLEMHGKM